MLLDTFTIIVCATLIVLAVVSAVVFNVFRRRPTDTAPTVDAAEMPPLSVVIPVHDNAAELERNLPAILSQDYAPGFEVIVVDESSTDDTLDVLKRLRLDNPHLYITFIPASSHYLSRRKLSISVGVKAAKNEWVVFTTADARPTGDAWLAAIGSRCSTETDMVLGYSNYDGEASAFKRFFRLRNACHRLRCASHGQPYASAGKNMAIRKNLFMERNGFQLDLRYLRGEYDFLVNEYGEQGRTAIALDSEAYMVEDTPSRKSWLNDNIFYMETRKHLGRSLSYRFIETADTLLLHVNLLVQIAAIAVSAVFGVWSVTVAAAVGLLLAISLRLYIVNRAVQTFSERLPLWLIPLLEPLVLWRRVTFLLRYRAADKNDFIRR